MHCTNLTLQSSLKFTNGELFIRRSLFNFTLSNAVFEKLGCCNMTSGACPGSALDRGNQSMRAGWHITPHSPGRALTGGISAHQWHNRSPHTVLALTVGINAHQWHIIVTLSCHWPEMHYSSKTLKSTCAVINIP